MTEDEVRVEWALVILVIVVLLWEKHVSICTVLVSSLLVSNGTGVEQKRHGTKRPVSEI